MNLNFPALSVTVGPTGLVRGTRGQSIDIDAGALSKPAPPMAHALSEILNCPDSVQLLLGLNEMFGGAREYAIAGSVALAVHQTIAGYAESIRQPNDLDLVVSEVGMQRLSYLEADSVEKLGFHYKSGDIDGFTWLGRPEQPLRVDIIPSKNMNISRGFSGRTEIKGVNVMPLLSLKHNLEDRALQDQKLEQTRKDLESIGRLENRNLEKSLN